MPSTVKMELENAPQKKEMKSTKVEKSMGNHGEPFVNEILKGCLPWNVGGSVDTLQGTSPCPTLRKGKSSSKLPW